MPHIQINGTQYYYKLQGQGDPLVLIAGYASDHTIWNLLFDELSQRFQVLAFDNKGIGQTRDEETPFTIEEMATDTYQLIQELGLIRPTLVGHSMGGVISQLIAKKHPNFLSNLIILNAAEKINRRTLMALESFIRLLKEGASINTVIEASFPWFYSPEFLSNQQNINLMMQTIMSNPFPQTFDDLIRQMNALNSFKAEQYPQPILTPTLVIGAKEDIICLPEESAQLAKRITNSRLIMLAKGHVTPVEEPMEVLNTIVEFVLRK